MEDGQRGMAGRTASTSIMMGLGILGMLLAFANGLSNALTVSDPASAIIANSLNVEARINRMKPLLRSEQPLPKDAMDEAQKLLSLAPADARAYSILGEVLYRQGRDDEARSVFAQSRELARTELVMLIRTTQMGLADGDYRLAGENLEILLRRWPGRLANLSILVSDLMGSQEGQKQVFAMMKRSPGIANHMLSALLREDGGQDLAMDLMLEMRARRLEIDPGALSKALSSLFAAKRLEDAFRLYQMTLPANDRMVSGYVFDRSFTRAPDVNPFHWQLADTKATSSEWVKATQGGEMRIRFLNKPVRNIGLRQFVVLPRGDYRFETSYRTVALRAPKGLFWSLSCVTGGPRMIKLPIREGNNVDIVDEIVFSTGEMDCPVFRLQLETDLIAESFNYRYAGMLAISGVSITRVTQ